MDLNREYKTINEVVEMGIIAAKVELGTEQTLAKRDSNNEWQLLEIPNYQNEFIKCCYY